MAKKINEEKIKQYRNVAKEVIKKEMPEYVEDNYLPFSFSVCLDRALVYCTDGLKPIQRRILYTAYKTGMTDKSAKVKSATFEGRVMDYSPHGGSYGSIVNIAAPEVPGQPRSLRVPLVRGKGNWGSIAGGAAAARYTEMNLWPAAMELLKELDENAVEMVPNYNGTLQEPKYLPARWPVAIINGVPDAMAVGFACNLPSHNPDEIMDACVAILNDPEITDAKLEKIIKGPDFDCGCDIIAEVERDGEVVNGIKSYIETGKGSFIMRGKYELSEHNGKYTINFHQLPYKISPEKVIEECKKQYEKGNLKELASWADLSDMKNPVNLEFVTKKGISIDKVLNDLFKMTSLQCIFAANCTIVTNDMIPEQVGVKQILKDFLKFRESCTRNKLNYRLDKKKAKLHIQEALNAVLLDIDKCINIIRNSQDESVAKQKLMKTFKIDEKQAEYVLSLQLRKLTKADKHEIKSSIDQLKKEIKELESILKDKKKFVEFIKGELEDTKKIISSPRKCKIYKTDKEDLQADDVFIEIKGTRVKRSFKSNKKNFSVGKDGRIMIITYKDGADIRSVFELPDEQAVAVSNFSELSGRAICAAGNEGYLVLVGIDGMMKIVDLSTVELPKGNNIKTVLGQPVKMAFVVKEINGELFVNEKKHIPLKKLPLFGISAKGNKVYNKHIDKIKYIKE